MQFFSQPSFLHLALLTSPLLTSACLTIGGEGHVGAFATDVTIGATDDGVETCSGTNDEAADVPCIEGYSMSYDWGVIEDPVKVHYCNPEQCWDLEVPNYRCDNQGNICCGGNVSIHPSIE